MDHYSAYSARLSKGPIRRHRQGVGPDHSQDVPATVREALSAQAPCHLPAPDSAQPVLASSSPICCSQLEAERTWAGCTRRCGQEGGRCKAGCTRAVGGPGRLSAAHLETLHFPRTGLTSEGSTQSLRVAARLEGQAAKYWSPSTSAGLVVLDNQILLDPFLQVLTVCLIHSLPPLFPWAAW